MQDIVSYLYPTLVEVQLNNDPTITLRNRVVYARPVKIYKGIDNLVNLIFKNHNQKPVNLLGLTLDFNVLDDTQGSVFLSKTAIVTDTITAAKMRVVGATVSAAGAGVLPGDVLTVAGGTRLAPATFTVTTTRVVAATIATGGSGYVDGVQTLTVTTGTGVAASVRVTVANGAVTGIVDIPNPGSYTVNPTLSGVATTVLNTGAGATLNLTMGANALTNNAVASQEYTALPTIVANEVTTSGTGTGTRLTLSFGVESVEVIQGGAAYYSTEVIFTGGSPITPATATATIEPPVKAITTVTVNSAGSGYTAIPVVSFKGAKMGQAVVMLTELDLLDLPRGHYHYSLKATEVSTGLEQAVYADDNFDARGQLLVLDGHYPTFKPSIDVLISTMGAGPIYTSQVAADTPTRRQSAHHTAQFFFDTFTGDIEIQGTLDPIPPNGVDGNTDSYLWSTIDTLSFVDQTATVYQNWSGVYSAFRFVVTVTSGNVSKILYRS